MALFNTLHRVSESLAAVEDFRKLYKETQKAAELEASSSAAAAAATTRPRKAQAQGKRPKSSSRTETDRQERQTDEISQNSHGWRAAAVAVIYTAYETLWKGCRGCWGVVERVLGGVTGPGGKGEL